MRLCHITSCPRAKRHRDCCSTCAKESTPACWNYRLLYHKSWEYQDPRKLCQGYFRSNWEYIWYGEIWTSLILGFLTPDLWKETGFTANPYEEFSDVLRDGQKKATY